MENQCALLICRDLSTNITYVSSIPQLLRSVKEDIEMYKEHNMVEGPIEFAYKIIGSYDEISSLGYYGFLVEKNTDLTLIKVMVKNFGLNLSSTKFLTIATENVQNKIQINLRFMVLSVIVDL